MKMTLEQWKSAVKSKYPKAKLIKGGGYGEASDWTAYVGLDMQADIVGVFSKENEFYSIGRQEGEATDRRAQLHRALDAVMDKAGK